MSAAAPQATPVTGTPPLGRALVALPSRLPVLFFWTSLVVALAILLEVFTPWVVLPATAGIAALTWRWVPDRLPATRAAVEGAGWALGLVVLWLAANAWFVGQILLVQRDPGFLTLAGIWLREHADPDIPLRTAAEVAARLPDVSPTSDAFWRSGDDIYAQGAKTFPGLIAMAGWVAGQPGVLAGNLLIGALALLAVYDVGRRLLGPGWALLPMGALALSTPMIYFSRSPFTEPTNIVLTFGGLAVLWGAFRGARMWPFALGGAMVGASALSRIDGAAVAAGLVVSLAVVAAGTQDRVTRRYRVRGFLVGSAAAGAMVLLGYLDVRVHSTAYLADHAWLYGPLVAMLGASFVAALALVVLTRWAAIPRWLAAHARILGAAAAIGTLAVCALLALRPLFWQRNGIEPGSSQAWFIAAMQQAAGVAVDATRSYDEMTVVWLAWYLGPLTVALAAVGAALLARRAVVDRRPELLAVLVILAVPSLLYLVRPSITPDQIWAMRRFLPAVLPAALLCAAWLLQTIVVAGRRRWQRAGGWLAAGLMLLAPVATWGTLVTTAEYGGRAHELAQLCPLVEGRTVVVVRGADPPLLPTLRILCDADVVEVPAPVGRDDLARIRRAWGGGDLLVVSMSAEAVGGLPEVPTLSTPMARWPHSLTPSFSPIRFTSRLWVAEVAPDGSVSEVPPVTTDQAVSAG